MYIARVGEDVGVVECGHYSTDHPVVRNEQRCHWQRHQYSRYICLFRNH